MVSPKQRGTQSMSCVYFEESDSAGRHYFHVLIPKFPATGLPLPSSPHSLCAVELCPANDIRRWRDLENHVLRCCPYIQLTGHSWDACTLPCALVYNGLRPDQTRKWSLHCYISGRTTIEISLLLKITWPKTIRQGKWVGKPGKQMAGHFR